MAKGKKTPPEIIHMIMELYAACRNANEVARELNVPESTVRKVIKQNENTKEFAELCAQKKELFSQKATEIINSALERLQRDIEDPEKNIPVNHLTTVIGTLYDKRALAEGTATENVSIMGDVDINKLAELAGYEKK
ncbi:MAG: helix-turn-helix domain-containing protein [Oscillospiraceae bacterium]|nr:helix-turn-helix domain-containing protein [Oscillospiraceae bacterium]